MAPLTGVPLPFVSYGNSNLIVMLGGHGPAAERGRARRPGRPRSGASGRAAPSEPATEERRAKGR